MTFSKHFLLYDKTTINTSRSMIYIFLGHFASFMSCLEHETLLSVTVIWVFIKTWSLMFKPKCCIMYMIEDKYSHIYAMFSPNGRWRWLCGKAFAPWTGAVASIRDRVIYKVFKRLFSFVEQQYHEHLLLMVKCSISKCSWDIAIYGTQLTGEWTVVKSHFKHFYTDCCF